MKKLRLLVGSIALSAVLVATSVAHNQPVAAGSDPVPICLPDGCYYQ